MSTGGNGNGAGARPDEAARRKPGFVAGTPVVLADGAAWQFRRPVVEFVIAETESGFEERLAVGDDGTFSRLTARLRGLREDRDGGRIDTEAFIATELAVGAALLRANYDLTTAEVADLMPFGYWPADPAESDPTGAQRIRNEVMAVARGDGPKA